MKMLHRGEKGFTLIELLVVIAILGVIAAVVALNISGFFGEGTVQAANTELHQVQTAVISLMAAGETDTIVVPGDGYWAGGNATAPYYTKVVGGQNVTWRASDYVFGPFRAAYHISTSGEVLDASLTHADIGNPWTNIAWNSTTKSWQES